MRIHSTSTAQEIGKIPSTNPASRLIVQSGLNISLQGTKLFGLLQNIGHGRLLQLFRQKIQCGSRFLGKFAHDINVAEESS
jgi:hypothetical protein